MLRNPVIHKPAYRYYVINLLPNLRVLDFKRIRMKVRLRVIQRGRDDYYTFQEKAKAKELFGGKKKTAKVKTYVITGCTMYYA